jgi:3-oxoadipate enol-lactonase
MRVTVDDAEIDVTLEGDGDPIVLIHGFPLTREIWDAQASQLARRALVIRPDLRGMGRSSVADGPYLMETLAGDIAAVLDALGIDRAAIAGHSLGGYVAMAFARMYTERLKKLALVCSRLAADSAQTARDREDLADRAERENRADIVVNAYLPRLFAPAFLQQRSALAGQVERIALRNDPRGLAAMLRGMAQRIDSADIAEDLGMQVLIVAGGADQVVGVREAEQVCRAFREGTLHVLERSGHLPMIEEPEALCELLTDFLVEAG